MNRYKLTTEGKGKEKQYCITDIFTDEVVARYHSEKKAQGIVDKANEQYRAALAG